MQKKIFLSLILLLVFCFNVYAVGPAIGFGQSVGGGSAGTGTLGFMETDLALPGKNGLNLDIKRIYHSLLYKSESDENILFGNLWGGWMAHGWSFNFAQRIFIVEPDDNLGGDNEKRIVLEINGGMEAYYFSSKNSNNIEQYFKPARDSNLNEIVFFNDYNTNKQKIIIKTSTGITYEFTKLFYQEYHSTIINYSKVNLLQVKGFYLTGIKDLNNNKITIEYETLYPETPFQKTLKYYDKNTIAINRNNSLANIIGRTYYKLGEFLENLDDTIISFNNPYTLSFNISADRPKKIIDSYSREISFTYDDTGRHPALINKTTMITGISYNNVNGSTNTIKYTYDANNNLTSVQNGSLPAQNYEYSYYVPNFKFYSQIHYITIFGYTIETFRYDSVEYPDSAFALGANESQELEEYKGYLIKKIISPMGAATEYTFQDNLQQMPKNVFSAYTSEKRAIPDATYPILTSKKTSQNSDGTGENYTITYTYPLDANGKPKMTAFYYDKVFSYIYTTTDTINKLIASFIGSADSAMRSHIGNYFATVTQKTTAMGVSIADKIYAYKQGVLQSTVSGIFSAEYDYYDDYTLKSETAKIAGIQKSQKIYSYDAYYNPISLKLYNGTNLEKELQSAYYTSGTAFNNRLYHLKQSEKIVKDGNSFSEMYYIYSASGQILQIHEASSASNPKKNFAYDSYGRLIFDTTRGLTGYIAYEYNDADTYDGKTCLSVNKKYYGTKSYLEKTYFDKNSGLPLSNTDVNGAKTIFNYDDYGRSIKTTFPNNATKETDYSKYFSDKKLIETINNARIITTYFDNFGRTTKIDYPDGEDDISYHYYFGNNLNKTTQGTTVIKQIENYDQYLRPQKITTPLGTMSYSYDDANNRVAVTDYAGRVTVKTMDNLGRLDNENFNNSEYVTNYSGYNAFGMAEEVKDARGLYHQLSIDKYGKIINTYHTNTDANTKTQKTYSVYDLATNLLRELNIYDEAGNYIKSYKYNYDEYGRVSQTFLNSSGQETAVYDDANSENSNGKLSSIFNAVSSSKYDYDNMGNIKKETKTIKAINKAYSYTYAYNTDGQLSEFGYSDEKKLNYGYDTNKRLKKMTYDNANVAEYFYNSNGTVQSVILGPFAISYTYEKQVLVKSITVKKGEAIMYQENYAYDNLGNITDYSHTSLFTLAHKQRNVFFNYNTACEVTAVKYDDMADYYKFSYDKNGNRLLFNHPKYTASDANYQINPNSDKLDKFIYPDKTQTSFGYDEEGNINHITHPNGKEMQYVYNYQKCLTEAKTKPNGSSGYESFTRYQYDTSRQRVYREASLDTTSETTFYHWDLFGHIVGEGRVNNGAITEYNKRYIYSGNAKIAMIYNGQMYYFINNLQGTPVLITDSSGTIVERIQLDLYGNIEQVAGIIDDEINYTGKKLDQETGLYYFNQRYYDPELGRFLQEDPAGQYRNPYLYCSNNPLTGIDPYGLWGIGFNIGIFGFSIGDQGVSVTAFFVQVGVNFSDGSAYGGFNASIGGYVDLGESIFQAKISIGASYTHNFSHGGDDFAGISGGTSLTLGGTSIINGMASHDFNTGRNYQGINFNTNVDLNQARKEYKRYVGHDPKMGPCKGVPGDGTIPMRNENQAFIEGANCIGNPKEKNTAVSWYNPVSWGQGFIENIWPGREGDWYSGLSNNIPGQNAFSYLHDSWSTNLFYSAIGIPFGQVTTYGAWLRSQMLD